MVKKLNSMLVQFGMAVTLLTVSTGEPVRGRSLIWSGISSWGSLHSFRK